MSNWRDATEQARLAIAEWIMAEIGLWFVPKRYKSVYLEAIILAMSITIFKQGRKTERENAGRHPDA